MPFGRLPPRASGLRISTRSSLSFCEAVEPGLRVGAAAEDARGRVGGVALGGDDRSRDAAETALGGSGDGRGPFDEQLERGAVRDARDLAREPLAPRARAVGARLEDAPPCVPRRPARNDLVDHRLGAAEVAAPEPGGANAEVRDPR